ncbi:hypothetical protein MRX96_012372 [Rhipicephalus microplus]
MATFHNLLVKLRLGDAAMFHNFMRMSPQQFDFLENFSETTHRGSKHTSPFCHFRGGASRNNTQKNLMKPYPGTQAANSAKRIYNYRLSRARRCVENAFGVMCACWRVLRNRMSLLPDNAVFVVAACCCLHNFPNAGGKTGLVATVLRSSQTPLEAQENSFQVTGGTPPHHFPKRTDKFT